MVSNESLGRMAFCRCVVLLFSSNDQHFKTMWLLPSIEIHYQVYLPVNVLPVCLSVCLSLSLCLWTGKYNYPLTRHTTNSETHLHLVSADLPGSYRITGWTLSPMITVTWSFLFLHAFKWYSMCTVTVFPCNWWLIFWGFWNITSVILHVLNLAAK